MGSGHLPVHARVGANGFWLVSFLRGSSFSSRAAFSGFVLAAPLMAVAAAPSLHVDACLQAASAKHAIAYPLLRSIAQTESSFNPAAVRRPFAAGGDGSTDYGLMQINSSWLPVLARYGISVKDLFNPCVSADVGGWILAQNFRRFGVSWDAVGAYNAVTPWKRSRYSALVYSKLQRFLGAPPSSEGIAFRTRSSAVGFPEQGTGAGAGAQDVMGVWEASDD